MPPTFAAYAASVWCLAKIKLGQRYGGTFFGIGWSLIAPMTMVGVLWLVFTKIFPNPDEFFVAHIFAGLLPWQFLSATIAGSTASLVSRKAVLDCMPVPPIVLVAVDVTVELLSFVISFSAVLALALVFLLPISPSLLLLPLMILPIAAMAAALSVVCALVGAMVRDLGHIIGVLFGAMFWFLPITYHWSQPPGVISFVAKYNPFALMIAPIQVVVHGGSAPTIDLMLAATGFAALSVVLAVWVYRKLAGKIIFYL